MELKPCPFCGEAAMYSSIIVELNPVKTMYFIECCGSCGMAELATEAFETKEDAAKQWNARPIEDELCKRIAELEDEVSRFETWT